jgi:hypothetical protein
LAVYETNYRLPHCSKKGAGERHPVLSRDTPLYSCGLGGNMPLQTLFRYDFQYPNDSRVRTPGVWPRFFLMLKIASHITCLHSQVSDWRPKRWLGMHVKRHLADTAPSLTLEPPGSAVSSRYLYNLPSLGFPSSCSAHRIAAPNLPHSWSTLSTLNYSLAASYIYSALWYFLILLHHCRVFIIGLRSRAAGRCR